MATIPEISQLIIEETLEWQKPLIHNLVCECVDIEVSLPYVDYLLIECVDIEVSLPNVDYLLIEWEEVVDSSLDVLFFAQL